jgi:hypothetical protein
MDMNTHKSTDATAVMVMDRDMDTDRNTDMDTNMETDTPMDKDMERTRTPDIA